jgi:hypothetical protein
MSDERSEWQKRIGVGERQVKYGVHAGRSIEIPKFREDNGKLGGKQTEHWDGRVDATIIAPTVVQNIRTGEVSSES